MSGEAAIIAGAAVANATKAMGGIVFLAPHDFQTLASAADRPLIVHAPAKGWGTRHRYILGHRGLVFFTKSKTPLQFRSRADVVTARRIWVPSWM